MTVFVEPSYSLSLQSTQHESGGLHKDNVELCYWDALW